MHHLQFIWDIFPKDGQQAHEKRPSISNHEGNANQNYNEIPPHTMPGTSTGHPTHDKVTWRDLMSKADQYSRDPLDLLEHLPQNQNLSVLLFHEFHEFHQLLCN